MTSTSRPKLNFLDTAFYAIAVGIGMRWIVVAAALGPASLPLWALALVVYYAPLACATAEMTARFESEGGIYVWARDLLGPLPGFICGWFYWVNLMPYFAGLLVFLSGLVVAMFGGDPKDVGLCLSISVAASLFVTGIQLAGLKFGKWVPNAGTAGTWIVFAVIVAMALLLISRGYSATDFRHASWRLPFDFNSALLWGTILFAYGGVESLGFLRNEMKGGLGTLLRVLALVGIGSLVIYIIGTAAFLVILPKAELTRLAGFPDALRLGLQHVGLAWMGTPTIGLFALATLGGFTAWFGVGARLPFAVGLDNFLPAAFARRSARTGAPVTSILVQGAIMLAFVVLSQAGTSVAGAYDLLVAMGILTGSIPYVFAFAAYAKCARLPAIAGAWAPPGGRRTSLLLAWLGQIATLVAIGCTLVPNSGDAHPLAELAKIVLSTLAMLFVGLVFYSVADRKRKRRSLSRSAAVTETANG